MKKIVLTFFVTLLTLAQAVAQDVRVSGVVKDNTGAPLAGVAVVMSGNLSRGTATNANGTYEIAVPKTASLIFSYLGMQSQTIAVEAKTKVDVVLESDAANLDEVIVIGYGTIKKRDLTGSVSSVKGADLTLSPSSNPMIDIQGRVPGLDITRTSGQPGAGLDIQLRGNRSFTASGNPLILIDGMPGDYATINPNDIESVEVLKDASSTAVYGSAGANGVIIITTKKPQSGKVTVDFNAYYGINGWSVVPKMRGSGPEYINALRDASAATGRWTSSADDKSLFLNDEEYKLYKNGNFLDWNKAMLQSANTQNYSLSVSGGNDKTTGYLSFNYSDEAGQYKADNYKVYSTVMRVENKPTKWLKIGANMQASYVDRSKAYSNLENALTMYPLGKLYEDNGSIRPQPTNSASRVYNLLLNSQPGVYDDIDNNFRIYFNPYIEINPIKGLTIQSRIGTSLSYSKNKKFQGFNSYQWYEAGKTDASVKAEVAQNRGYGYTWENIATYNFQIANDHDFTLTGVTTWSDSQNESSRIVQTNIKENKYKWNNMSPTSLNSTAETSYSMSKGMGYVARLNYSYRGKYLFQASIRYDGSSKLYPTERWSSFPAFSAGWRVSQEKFMEGTQSWLNNLKLRASWGITGTAKIDPYSSAQALESGDMLLGGMAQKYWKFSQNVTNNLLTWEKSKTTDIGLDATLFDGRIDIVLDWYDTNTEGVIWARPLPIVFGAYDAKTQYISNMNIASTSNQGWEFAINTRNIVNRDFRWSSTLTFSANKEKITKLLGGESNFLNTGSDNIAFKVGEPIQSFYDYQLNGIWQSSEAADALVFNAKPGDIKINVPGMQKESDGVFYKYNTAGEKVVYNEGNKYTISATDYQVIGHKSPNWSLGFQNSFSYKSFDLVIYAYMRWGQMIKYNMLGSYDPKGVQNFPSYFDYWTPKNPSNFYPAANADKQISDYTGYSALQFVDGSFFKIKNITLGYTLPERLFKRTGISKLRVYGTITNPVVVAASPWIQQYDPEMAGAIKYPLTRQLVFGVNFTF